MPARFEVSSVNRYQIGSRDPLHGPFDLIFAIFDTTPGVQSACQI